VGAIVGGGILALTGVAFATTGPAALVAFAANGAIAALTAVSFARLARAFPESGGTYTYAKKVLSIEVAFSVGWVVWFASIVAAVLYALGFAAFATEAAARLLGFFAADAGWLREPVPRLAVALAATAFYTASLVRRAAGGGQWATVGKVIVFAVLIAGGSFAWLHAPEGTTAEAFHPFLPEGMLGLARAMGYTFIALQGFDLIAAVGGEVRDPRHNLPRAIYVSLGLALAIYLPLLFLITTVGVGPERSIEAAAAANPEGLVAEAAERFLGPVGYWLVLVAGVLSMLSALQANLFGASRVAFAMARDRTLPRWLGQLHAGAGTPAVAVVLTAGAVLLVTLAVGDVAAAGAASSLIFLISFAMVHWAAILAGRRSGARGLPAVAALGALLCLALALFQGFAVPEAGRVVTLWLGAGAALYFTWLAPGARLADASAEALDPDHARLRGRSPLVLVPIANPATAASLVGVAGALRTPGTGRLLLLHVVPPPERPEEPETASLRDAPEVLAESLRASFERELAPETVVSVAPDPWQEIVRVARLRRCETLLLGFANPTAPGAEARTEELMQRVPSDVVVLRAPHRWRIRDADQILVPLGGRRDHGHLRARLLASLARWRPRTVTFLRIVPTTIGAEALRRAEREVRAIARDEASGPYQVEVVASDDPGGELARRVAACDLAVLGIRRPERRGRLFGEFALRIARETTTPLLLISRRS